MIKSVKDLAQNLLLFRLVKVQKNIFKSPTPYNKKTCDACSDKKSVEREAWSVEREAWSVKRGA